VLITLSAPLWPRQPIRLCSWPPVVLVVRFSEELAELFPIDFFAQPNRRMSQTKDADQFGFEQIALRIMRRFNRFAISLRFIASHS